MTEDASVASKKRSGASKGYVRHDLKTAALASLLGIAALAAVDYIATLVAATGALRIGTAFRLLLLEMTLAGFLFILVLPLSFAAALAARLAMKLWRAGELESYQGLFGPANGHESPSKAAAWLWGATIACTAFLAVSTLLTLKLATIFKEPQLTAFVLAVLQLTIGLACFALASAIAAGVTRVAEHLQPRLGIYNPFGSAPAAALILVLLSWPVIRLLLRLLPQLGPLIEWRHALSTACFVSGAYAATLLLAKRGHLFPRNKVRRLQVIGALGLGIIVLAPATLMKWGADQDTKALAISSSPTMSKTMNLLRRATDFDGDGFGSLLGENDCGPFNAKVHPLARDIPDNGTDENCDGRDFKLGTLPSYKSGETMPVPEAFQDNWNFLLITIDTVRYDHTTFGGYARDTTPELAKFVDRSANFTFANAPSAGTMASIPAILTSKFFHSGIALEEDVPRGSPPKLKDENTLLHELFKKKGYSTGAILSHEYFNDWGMDQGVDTYDNTVGKKRNPSAVTSPILTDRSIAWIGKQKNRKWFLWTHYIDPHGYYVSHPGDTSYGDSEMDLYDGELHFTDKHLAKLLDYVGRSARGNKTIIAITSDHGDAFGEHGYINHAQDLHREILHVPLIFYVPNIEPRSIPGAVSPIDIFPTFADLIGADISDLNVEGVSLVPQLFYGKDAEDRIVFSETNYPKPLRAVVNSRYKLIVDLKNNVSRLWDLKKDPLEKKNIWTQDKVGYAEMRGYLNEWLERVVYSRDQASNQAMAKLADHMVGQRPATATAVEGVHLEDASVSVDSFELQEDEVSPGEVANFAVYFRTKKVTTRDLKFQLEVWIDEGPNKSRSAKSRNRLAGAGMFPTSRWHPGELVRDRFKVTLPAHWKSEKHGQKINVGLRVRASGKDKPTVQGPLRAGTTDLVILGQFKLSNETPVLPPPPTAPGMAPKIPPKDAAKLVPGLTPKTAPRLPKTRRTTPRKEIDAPTSKGALLKSLQGGPKPTKPGSKADPGAK
jgi:arylsulfatase A-like enzyme